MNNTNIFLNLVESIRKHNINCRILSIGSSEQYGLVEKDNLPLIEMTKLNPISPYAIAKVSQEMMSNIYTKGYGLDIVNTRSFNHIGPDQNANYVISSLVKQIVELKYNLNNKTIKVGNIDIVRDFIDVRDVANAYMAILLNGKQGEIYNVCSGIGYSIKEILRLIMEIANVNFEVEINYQLYRPIDNPIIIGDNSKLKLDCNWKQYFSFEASIIDMLEFWNSKLFLK